MKTGMNSALLRCMTLDKLEVVDKLRSTHVDHSDQELSKKLLFAIADAHATCLAYWHQSWDDAARASGEKEA
jgi:hypothetical protein